MASCEDVIRDAVELGHSVLHFNCQNLTYLPDDLWQPALAKTVKNLYLKQNLLSKLVRVFKSSKPK